MPKNDPRPMTVDAQGLAPAAQAGVERALAARRQALQELSPEDIEQVGGAALSLKLDPSIYGYLRQLTALQGSVIQPGDLGAQLPTQMVR